MKKRLLSLFLLLAMMLSLFPTSALAATENTTNTSTSTRAKSYSANVKIKVTNVDVYYYYGTSLPTSSAALQKMSATTTSTTTDSNGNESTTCTYSYSNADFFAKGGSGTDSGNHDGYLYIFLVPYDGYLINLAQSEGEYGSLPIDRIENSVLKAAGQNIGAQAFASYSRLYESCTAANVTADIVASASKVVLDVDASSNANGKLVGKGDYVDFTVKMKPETTITTATVDDLSMTSLTINDVSYQASITGPNAEGYYTATIKNYQVTESDSTSNQVTLKVEASVTYKNEYTDLDKLTSTATVSAKAETTIALTDKFTVTAKSGSGETVNNITVTPSDRVVYENGSATVTWNIADNYELDNVSVAGIATAVKNGNSLSLSNIASNITVTITAKPKTFNITYVLGASDAENGSSNPDTYKYGIGVAGFENAARENYNFDGWYSDASLTEKVTSISTTANTDITLYAKWVESTDKKPNEKLDSIVLIPQTLTAYVGGISQNGSSMPKFRYDVALPENVDMDDLTFSLHTVKDGKETVKDLDEVSLDEDDDDTYYLFPELAFNMGTAVESSYAVMYANYLKLVHKNDTATTESGVYTIELRTEDENWDSWYVTAEDGEGNVYSVEIKTDDVSINIREVSDGNDLNDHIGDYITPVVNTEEELTAAVASTDGAVAIASEDTVFTTNGNEKFGLLGVHEIEGVTGFGDEMATVALLFDDTVSLSSDITTEELEKMMIEYAQNKNGEDYSNWNAEHKYLDLVNINDGNAVVTTSQAVDIYWPYPDGITYETAGNYDFKLLHFDGMDREKLAEAGLESYEDFNLVNMEVTATEYGLKFSTKTFSPFTLVWKAKDKQDNDSPDNTVPPALNTENHYAYIIGYKDGNVCPTGTITRAEVATIFFRLLTDEAREAYLTTENDFTDVNEGQWFNTAVSTLASMGILNGKTATTFAPNSAITRAELASICARFDGKEAASSNAFSDISGHWAESEILRSADLGWVLGYPDGTFKPEKSITRAETMTMINRVLGRVPQSKADLCENMIVWPDNMDEDMWYYLAIQEATNSHDYTTDKSREVWYEITETPDWKKYETK